MIHKLTSYATFSLGIPWNILFFDWLYFLWHGITIKCGTVIDYVNAFMYYVCVYVIHA